jgi:hypothetical protein
VGLEVRKLGLEGLHGVRPIADGVAHGPDVPGGLGTDALGLGRRRFSVSGESLQEREWLPAARGASWQRAPEELAFVVDEQDLVNERKELFNVTLAEIERAVTELHGEVELTLAAEAAEYRQSVAIRSKQGGSGPVSGMESQRAAASVRATAATA